MVSDVLPFAVGGANGGFGVFQQRGLVLLGRQHIVAAPRHDRFGHRAMTMQSIGGDHAAFELQKLEQLQGAVDFVVVRRQDVGERHPRLRCPRRHHDRRHMALAAFVAAPQRLAVERNHPLRTLDLRALRKRDHEAPECCLEGLRIDHAKDPAEGVVAWQTILKHKHVLPEVGLHHAQTARRRHTTSLRTTSPSTR